MSDTAFTVEYEITPEWERILTNPRQIAGISIWSYYVASYISLVALVIIVLAGFGIALAVLMGWTVEGLRLLAVLGGVMGAVLVIAWARQVHHTSCQDTTGFYKIGTPTWYRFDADGLHIRSGEQDWQTGWALVRDIRLRGEVLSIWTPIAVFALPVSKLPLPAEEAMARMRSWQEEAQGV